MITFEILLTGLFIVSVLTSLSTEAVKKVLSEHKIAHQANTLTGIISLVLSLVIGFGYVILCSVPVTAQVVVSIIALSFMSWLCAMVGYDKVIQAIKQFKSPNKE